MASRAGGPAVRIAGFGAGDAADDTDRRVSRARRAAGTTGVHRCADRAGAGGGVAAGRRRICARPCHRHPRLRAVRRKPAVPDGHRRSCVVWARRVLRNRRLRGCAGGQARLADGSRARACSARSARRRDRVRLVLRAAVGRLPRHADPCLRADHLVDRIPVGQRDRWLERRRRRLARRVARKPASVLRVRADRLRRRPRHNRVDGAGSLRLRAPRGARFAAAGRSDRHRRPAHAMAGIRRSGRVRRARRRCLRLLQGQHFTRDARASAFGRRARHRAAGRPQRARRTADRRRGVHVAFRHARARHRILACGARHGDPRHRHRVPDGHRRRVAASLRRGRR